MTENKRYRHDFGTRSYEVDLNGALKPTELFRYLQETAEHQMNDNDLDYNVLYERERKAFILSRMSVQIQRPIYRRAHIEAETWISEGRAANFPRNFELRCDGECVARARSTWALVDVDTKKLIKFKEYDMGRYPVDEPPALDIPERFHVPKELEMSRVREVKVGYSSSDINGHMNNAMYLNNLFDCIPGVEALFVTSINIRYMHEAPLGASIEVFMSEAAEPDGLDPHAEKLVYFCTKSAGERNVEAVFGLRGIGTSL